MAIEHDENGNIVYRLWDNYKIIGGVSKDERKKFIVAISTIDGVKNVVIREYYYTKKTDKWAPKRGGLVIPIKVPIEKGKKILEPLSGLLQLVMQAVEELETFPLEDEDNMVICIKQYGNKKTVKGVSHDEDFSNENW